MVGLCKVLYLLLALEIVHCRTNNYKGNTHNVSQTPALPTHLPEQNVDAAKEAEEGDHPYLVQLRYGKTKDHFCGGSILKSYLILTAASCVYNQSKDGSLDGIEVVAGEHDRLDLSGNEQVRHIKEVFIHESYIYSTGPSDYDIALLVIQPEFKFDKYVQRIPIPSNVSTTAKAVLSGWGKKHKDDRNTAQVLNNMNLTVYNDFECKKSWETLLRSQFQRNVDMTKILCAKRIENNKTGTKTTQCDGDLGSPLVCTDFTNHISDRFLCGVASRPTRYCGEFSKPGVFANVRSFFSWIVEKSYQVDLTYGCPCGYFRCNNALCVNPGTLNDGNDDCGDETDESHGILDLFNNAKPMSKHWDVEDKMYKCHYNKIHPDRFRLISVDYLCDGFEDCPGNTDDICDNLKQNPSLCPNSVKEAKRHHSNITNCKHITDEMNCQQCKNGSTKCLNEYKCILNKKLCDGIPHCKDGSDEKNCISCNSKFSIHSKFRCDGNRDCPNGEDEENCPTPSPSIEPSAVSVLMASRAVGNISGVIELRQEGSDSLVSITGQVRGLLPNSTHGFHIHQSGDFRNTQNPCVSTGGHYNPLSSVHGAPGQTARHVGDLGNIQADENGVAIVNITDTVVSLIGPNSVIGRAFVVHEKVDDLGVNEGESKKTGNAGSRIACGIIGTIYAKPLKAKGIKSNETMTVWTTTEAPTSTIDYPDFSCELLFGRFVCSEMQQLTKQEQIQAKLGFSEVLQNIKLARTNNTNVNIKQ